VDPTSEIVEAPPAACPFPHAAAAAVAPAEPVVYSPLDLRMRRLLRLPLDAPKASVASARRVFEVSIYISAARCLLTYIVLPFVFPIIGINTSATPAVGIPVSLIAIAADLMSIRRFWRADHKYRWHYTVLAGSIITAMVVLIITDTVHLLT
jgi:hypothetical protein